VNKARGLSANWEVTVEASAGTPLLPTPAGPLCRTAAQRFLDINPEQRCITILHTVSKVVCQLTRAWGND